jgi:hypothetical protein
MFFQRPSDRVVADPVNDVQFHDLVFQQTQRPPSAPFGRFRTGQSGQFGLGRAIEDAPPGRGRRALGRQNGIDPFLNQLLANARDV